MSILTESTFEQAIAQSLIEHGGYEEGQSSDYNQELGLFKDEVLFFLQQTQGSFWARIATIHGRSVIDKGFIVCVRKSI